MRAFIEAKLVGHWYTKQRSILYYVAHALLLPWSWIFYALSGFRRWLYQTGIYRAHQLNVPVIVVGNISVGGTGKTPLVIWLVAQLKQAGYTPGIISRGFGGQYHGEVQPNSKPQEVGDEPVLIAQRTQSPVFVGAGRVSAGQALLNTYPQCDVIISDDGLQHYALKRDAEIVVVDSQRQFGNACLLPAGPLREPVQRLNAVGVIVANGATTQLAQAFTMHMQSGVFINVANPRITATVEDFQHRKRLAIAGIGNPERFFQQLTMMGLHCPTQVFPDHYAFQAHDFGDVQADIVLMTEKDAVKCTEFASGKLSEKLWYLPVDAVLPAGEQLMQQILSKLGGKLNSKMKE